MISLLGKTRQINRLLQRSESVEYDGISRVLSNVLEANVYITDESGAICGYALFDDYDEDLMVNEVIEQGRFPRKYVDWLNRLEETHVNLRVEGQASYEKEIAQLFRGQNIAITPIFGPRRRLGTLVVATGKKEFGDPDLLLCEYGATVVGMEMLRDEAQRSEVEARQREAVRIAVETLSYSERKAAHAILQELASQGKFEGRLIASRIADEAKITRSVIVNALRKFESAGVIESKSLGMKGTFVRVTNSYLMEKLPELEEYAADVQWANLGSGINL
ncbi:MULTISPECIES: GTP-sensing pleiotropic transcriptional regulator CodY [Selenomonas]|jgi:codY GAF-like domain|uniref:Global transcriptional regulator CodY n=2 Tax=Selenomonas TaxID=970 RepID=E7N2D1_9FIRM|nr:MULTISPECIES: GTP-sensing pleiotropic transcriptional regulator CodY [Selenomonas]EFR40181.1 CodY helix-turn-helix domain protein [Selenomonas sp. oral taxon 137 str. F0430]EFW29694.1 CodY helix-turn-helix domain protein [Selenomonas artemidis F0399]EJP34029.1 GTP-sensing transcriptional pleiotropic repressor CodY / CodY helix-turn-helix domain multi-domain protein [Selenomonas sp. FOBRC9]MBF1682076.1 GTP-sensing pleiotropic transcriptional regulator CodY [Selenomonas artemidis]